MANGHWLSFLVFFPLGAAALIALMPPNAHRQIKLWATLAALAEFVFSLPLWWRVVPGQAGFQFEENFAWIPAVGANYHLGVDGISALLALLTTFTTLIATWGAWTGLVKDATGAKGRALFHPLRLALTGRDSGPELKHFLPYIGRERAHARLMGKVG